VAVEVAQLGGEEVLPAYVVGCAQHRLHGVLPVGPALPDLSHPCGVSEALRLLAQVCGRGDGDRRHVMLLLGELRKRRVLYGSRCGPLSGAGGGAVSAVHRGRGPDRWAGAGGAAPPALPVIVAVTAAGWR